MKHHRHRASYALAAAVLAAPGPALAQSFHRLFSTAEERLQLDEARRDYAYGEPAPVQQRSAEQRSESPFSSLVINGTVVRHRTGLSSTWVNGTRVDEGQTTREGVVVREDARGAVKLLLPSGASTVDLKPGQKIDVATGRVLDAWQFKPEAETKGEAAFETGEGAASEATEGSESAQPAQPAVPTSEAAAPDSPAAARSRRGWLSSGEDAARAPRTGTRAPGG
ncbi:MAG: hypothetical protein H6983_21635 [Ectothiorhodospiraceae bacterium]|nr:hypothetical protein [Ectothiorhodospiraceae bacterium]